MTREGRGMSDEDRRWQEHCQPAFDRLHTDHEKLAAEVKGVLTEHDKRIRGVEIVTQNGYGARLKHVERMQWWQLGILASIAVALIINLLVG